MHLKMTSAKWRPFFLGLNVLIGHVRITGPSSPIDWDAFSEAEFAADVARKRDCEYVKTWNECAEFSDRSGRHEHDAGHEE